MRHGRDLDVTLPPCEPAHKTNLPAPQPPQKARNLLAHLGDQLVTALDGSPQRQDVLSAMYDGIIFDFFETPDLQRQMSNSQRIEIRSSQP